MAWETVTPVKPAYSATPSVPPKGLVITARKVNVRRYLNAPATAYIAVRIGTDLAKQAAIGADPSFVRIMCGTGSDANRLKFQVDHVAAGQAGCFAAKRQKNGNYLISINAASAEGRFALSFPPMKITDVEVVRPENGQPVFFHFKAEKAFFAVEE